MEASKVRSRTSEVDGCSERALWQSPPLRGIIPVTQAHSIQDALMQIPSVGRFAMVRARRGVIAAVEHYDDEGPLHRVHREYNDEQYPADEHLLWKLQPRARLQEPTVLLTSALVGRCRRRASMRWCERHAGPRRPSTSTPTVTADAGRVFPLSR
jgi:hypothetical protein